MIWIFLITNYLMCFLKPKIIENSKIPKFLSWVIDIKAIVLYPFIFVDKELTVTEKNHELIHFKQIQELTPFLFYFLYLVFWLRNSFKLRSFSEGYYAISFEKEAYGNQDDLIYLKDRIPYSWLHGEML